MINLSVITDEQNQAVLCKTLGEARALFEAVKEQRPHIDLKGWGGAPNDPSRHTNQAYILSYRGSSRLQYSSANFLKSKGIEIIPFERLMMPELPAPEAGEFGIEFLLELNS